MNVPTRVLSSLANVGKGFYQRSKSDAFPTCGEERNFIAQWHYHAHKYAYV